ncbi:DNA-binding protein [Pulveribacter sp.]|uniref:DNA-binding protein n=1 Tax=Pulveribacter sp. TaxID=2678893 RepID=UPI0039184F04
MKEKGVPPRRGRKGITREDVQRACEALNAQGRRIGPTNVRLELGRGSYGTIVRILSELGSVGTGKCRSCTPLPLAAEPF